MDASLTESSLLIGELKKVASLSPEAKHIIIAELMGRFYDRFLRIGDRLDDIEADILRSKE